MRFAGFLVPLLLITAVRAEAQQARPVIILVHGRGHLQDDSAVVRAAWKRDLDSALVLAGMPKLDDADVRLAWYADVMDPAQDVGCPVTRTNGDSAGFESFAREFFGTLASALPKDESPEARMLLGDILYAVDASRRCGAERRVAATIRAAMNEKRPVILVAYSLGSLVSYGSLTALDAFPKASVDIHFITIGSPLGNAEIRALLGAGTDAVRLPPTVRSWENIYDSSDAFAAPLEPAARGVRDRVLQSTSGADPHYIRRYLRDAATGAALARAICASTRIAPCVGR